MKIREFIDKLFKDSLKNVSKIEERIIITASIDVKDLQRNINDLAVDLHNLLETKDRTKKINFDHVELNKEQQANLLAYIQK